MAEVIIPIKKTVWGIVKSVEDLKKHVAKSGQFFGQDLSGPACEFKKEYPCDKTLYEYMGWGTHKGIDIPCGAGTEIYATHDGTVWKTSETVSQGLGVVLESLDEEFQTVYWHNKQNLVKAGDKVKVGQLIAYSDNTGYSKGNHLHFEFKLWKDSNYEAVDPFPYFDMNKLTKQQVKKLQALEGFNDPEGVKYWEGKELDQYLVARIPDKIKELENSLK